MVYNYLQLGSFLPWISSFQQSFSYISENVLLNKIREIVIAIFSKIASFSSSFNNRSQESNLKAYALFGCALLVVLLIISFRSSGSPTSPSPLVKTRD